ncbi:hypothetical protein H6504_03425 [Candidatus Woesearchaeota archaeon]|nr:hypothetical protein [Candidatus Woesearchaeota archaeon]
MKPYTVLSVIAGMGLSTYLGSQAIDSYLRDQPIKPCTSTPLVEAIDTASLAYHRAHKGSINDIRCDTYALYASGLERAFGAERSEEIVNLIKASNPDGTKEVNPRDLVMHLQETYKKEKI